MGQQTVLLDRRSCGHRTTNRQECLTTSEDIFFRSIIRLAVLVVTQSKGSIRSDHGIGQVQSNSRRRRRLDNGESVILGRRLESWSFAISSLGNRLVLTLQGRLDVIQSWSASGSSNPIFGIFSRAPRHLAGVPISFVAGSCGTTMITRLLPSTNGLTVEGRHRLGTSRSHSRSSLKRKISSS